MFITYVHILLSLDLLVMSSSNVSNLLKISLNCFDSGSFSSHSGSVLPSDKGDSKLNNSPPFGPASPWKELSLHVPVSWKPWASPVCHKGTNGSRAPLVHPPASRAHSPGERARPCDAGTRTNRGAAFRRVSRVWMFSTRDAELKAL